MNPSSQAGAAAELPNAPPRRFPRRSRWLLALIVLALSGSLVFILTYLSRLPAPDLFRQYVLDPIPASVNHIKVVQTKRGSGYMYVFRFHTNREDLDLLLASRALSEIQITNVWSDGEIWWKSMPTAWLPNKHYSVLLFHKAPPSWYTLPSWESPESYAFVKESGDSRGRERVQILVYSPRLEQAFFVTRYSSHTMPEFF